MIGHTAKEEATHAAASVAADHHEVHLLAASGIDDRLAGLTLPDEEGHPNTGSSTMRHEFLCPGFASGPNLIHAGLEPTAGKPKQPGIDDADDEQLRTQLAGQVERLQTGLFRCR